MSEEIKTTNNIAEDSKISRVQVAIEKINEQLVSLQNSETWKSYLKFMSSFTHYSVNNTLLLYTQMQNPDFLASHSPEMLVASANKWKEICGPKSHPLKGEHGLQIVCPSPYEKKELDAEGKEIVTTHMGFKRGYVFDKPQIHLDSAREIPEVVHILNSNDEKFHKILEAAKIVAGCPVTFEAIPSGANGFYSITNDKIVVSDSIPIAQQAKTLIHEISHRLAHGHDSIRDASLPGKVPEERNNREVEAESIAFVVLNALGVDSSEYSIGYIKGYSDDKLSEFKASIERIRSASQNIISEMEMAMMQVEKDYRAQFETISYYVKNSSFISNPEMMHFEDFASALEKFREQDPMLRPELGIIYSDRNTEGIPLDKFDGCEIPVIVGSDININLKEIDLYNSSQLVKGVSEEIINKVKSISESAEKIKTSVSHR